MAIVATDNTHYGNIAAAIREKNGLTAAYKPSEMADAIRAIQTGGELEIVNGSFIPAEDAKSFVVHHNLGRIPKLAFLLLADNDLFSRANPTARFVMSVQALENGNFIFVSNTGKNRAERPSYETNWMSSDYMKLGETTITFGSGGMNSSYWMLKAGVEYIWLIVG